MKVLIAISDSFCANFIKGQASYLVSQGHEVVILSGPGVEIDNLEKSEPAKVIRFPFAREIHILRDFSALFFIIRLIRKERPDVINAGNPKTGFLFSLSHILFGIIPLIFTLRGVRSDTLKGFKKVIVRLTEKITCSLADKVIVISPSLRDHAVETGLVRREKCVLLGKGSSNGVDISRFTHSKQLKNDAERILHNYNIPIRSFKFVFVGRVTKDKGVVEMLNAFLELATIRSDTSLIVAGPIEMADPLPPKYYQILERHPQIYYLGKVLDVRPIYTLADALILYSHREGFGNVVIEAASMGLPAIVADIPGLRDTIEPNRSGLLVEPKTESALMAAMLRYVDEPYEALKHGEHGLERIRLYFANEVIWSGQLSLYKSLVR